MLVIDANGQRMTSDMAIETHSSAEPANAEFQCALSTLTFGDSAHQICPSAIHLAAITKENAMNAKAKKYRASETSCKWENIHALNGPIVPASSLSKLLFQ